MPKFCCLIIRVFKRLFIINLTFIKQLMFENLFIHLLKKQSVDVMLGSEKIFVINEQSGKISRLFVQYLAFHNNGNFPKSLTYFPKLPNSK